MEPNRTEHAVPPPTQPKQRSFGSYLLQGSLVFLICLLPSLIIFTKARQAASEQLQERFQADASLSANIIANALLIHLVDLSALGRYLGNLQTLNRERFESFIRPFLAEHGGAQAYEWILKVPHEERKQFEEEASRVWKRPVRITQRLADGSLVPSQMREVYYPVYFVEPLPGNDQALGYDLGSNPVRLEALEAARDSGFPVASRRVRLVQALGAQHGFLLYHPVYAPNAPLQTVEERRKANKGFALGVFRFSDVLRTALSALRNHELAFELIDLAAPPGEEVLFNDFGAPWSGSAVTSRGETGYLYEHQMEYAGRPWLIRVGARPGYLNANQPLSYWLILPVGALISLLLSLFITGLYYNKARLERRTVELALANTRLEEEAAERRQALRSVDQILAAVSAILVGVDTSGKVTKWNAAAEQTLGLNCQAALGRMFALLPLPWDMKRVRDGLAACMEKQRSVKVNTLRVSRKGFKDFFLLLTINPIINAEGQFEGFLLLGDDISELKHMETQLIHSQKLESIGQMAAGIAHEINTPIQYVSDSTLFLKEAFDDLQRITELAASLPAEIDATNHAQAGATAHAIHLGLEEIDFPFLKTEAPKSFARVQDGLERVSTIVLAMKRFSHPGGEDRQLHDINKALENTLVVSRNEWKYVADVKSQFAPDLPPVPCVPGDINQVLLNIVVNAAHAIADVVANTPDRGLITVATRHTPGFVEISISDTGTGIPAANRDKVFDPFFTTKEVGKGTGQGLAIAYDIVVKKHGGTITFDTEEGQGTTFHLHLPLLSDPDQTGQGFL